MRVCKILFIFLGVTIKSEINVGDMSLHTAIEEIDVSSTSHADFNSREMFPSPTDIPEERLT